MRQAIVDSWVGVRTLWRTPVFVVLAALMILFGFVDLADRSTWTDTPVDWRVGLASSVDVLRQWIPMVSAVVASAWAGARVAADHGRDAFLVGLKARTVVLSSAIAPTIVTLAAAFVLTTMNLALAAVVWDRPAETANLTGSGIDNDLIDGRMLFLILLCPLWCWIGSALGTISGRRGTAIAVSFALFGASIVLERTAVRFPGIEVLYSLSPVGASNTLVLGTSIPSVASSSGTALAALLILTIWCVGIGSAGLSRGFQIGGSRWRHGLQGDEVIRTNRLARVSAFQRNLAVGGTGVILVVVGALLPAQLATQIPWYLKSSWLDAVAANRTPADSVEKLVDHLQSGDLTSARKLTAGAGWSELIPHLADMVRVTETFNDTRSSAPGSVVANVGEPVPLEDGSVLVQQQYLLCLADLGRGWRVVSLSEKGLDCEVVDE